MESKTIAQIQSEGYNALINALGPEDAIRFIRSFDPGCGDYTQDRKKYLKNMTVKQIGGRAQYIVDQKKLNTS